MPFRDRFTAGKLLAEKLPELNNPFVLAIPRGGVQVGAAMANVLNCELDVIVARKLGAPGNSELAIGAVTAKDNPYLDDALISELNVSKSYIENVVAVERAEAERRENLYRRGRPPLKIDRKDIILVDDGLATGATAMAAVLQLKNTNNRVILAVPVISKEAEEKLKEEVGEIIYLEKPEYFAAVSLFFEEFPQGNDKEVIELLAKSKKLKSSKKSKNRSNKNNNS